MLGFVPVVEGWVGGVGGWTRGGRYWNCSYPGVATSYLGSTRRPDSFILHARTSLSWACLWTGLGQASPGSRISYSLLLFILLVDCSRMDWGGIGLGLGVGLGQRGDDVLSNAVSRVLRSVGPSPSIRPSVYTHADRQEVRVTGRRESRPPWIPRLPSRGVYISS